MTHRHLTFFEMLGNFSIGDYFKEKAIEFALDLVTNGFGLDFDKIWISVFGGDEELGLGPDNEAIACWRAVGVPDERIILLGRDDNFWQSGPTGPCGPCSELHLDRGAAFGPDTDRPGDDTERYLEFWNLVFMQFELQADGSLPELPAQSIDTGMGLERISAVLQGVESVYETDLFMPLIELGEELSGRRNGQDFATTRALRILADHGRAAAILHRRRGRSQQRGARLHPAAHHASHHSTGPSARTARAVPADAVRTRGRGPGRRLSRTALRVAEHRALGAARRRRASGARSSRASACSATSSRGPRRRARPGWTPPTPSCSTTRTASPTR